MKKKLLLITTVFTLVLTASKAQTFDPAWAARFQHTIDSMNHETGGDTAGVTAAFYMPGQGLWAGTSGLTNPGVPMNTGIRVSIASNSKLFLATVMLKLQEQHVLSLDDHISKWIHTSLHNVDTSATIRQLLNHQSGIADFLNDRGGSLTLDDILTDTSRFFTPQEMVNELPAPFFAKGHGYHYSNTAYVICTMIIQAATGKHYWQNLHEQILSPLKMDSTDVWLYDNVKQNYSGGYYSTTNYPGPFTSFISMVVGNGDIYSTPQEMVQWYSKLFGGQVLTDSSLKQLLNIEPASSFGLGIADWNSATLGHHTYFFSGAWGTFESFAVYDRVSKACFFVATNYLNEPSGFAYPFLIAMFRAYRDGLPKKVNDAGITQLVSPAGTACSASVSPVVTLKNFGTANLRRVQINYKLDNGASAVYNWSGNLAYNSTINVTLPGMKTTGGKHNFMAYTAMPNNSAEGYTFNDTMQYSFVTSITPAYNGSFHEGFENSTTPIFSWSDANFNIYKWGVTELLIGHSGSHSLVAGSFNNNALGQVAYADLPVIHLKAGSNRYLSFSYSHAATSYGLADSLQLLVSADCGSTWHSLFYKGGPGLETSDSTDELFAPQIAAQWKTEKISLAAYSGDVLLRFREVNGNNNNIYLDDIAIDKASVILPIKLISFTGYHTGAVNELQWKASTTSATTFTVQRSANGRDFENIGNSNAPANTTDKTFSLTDNNLKDSKYYYRLQMKEADGQITYSNIVVLISNKDGLEITSFYPSPLTGSTGYLNITSAKSQKLQVVITDVAGHQLSTQAINTIAGSNNIPLILGKLAAGTYLLKIMDEKNGCNTIRFIKN